MKKIILFLILAISITAIVIHNNNSKKSKEIVSELASVNEKYLNYALGSDWKIIEEKKQRNRIESHIIEYTSGKSKENLILYRDIPFSESISRHVEKIVTDEIKADNLFDYVDKSRTDGVKICKNASMTLTIGNAAGNSNAHRMIDSMGGLIIKNLTYEKLMKFDPKYYLNLTIAYPANENADNAEECTEQITGLLVNLLGNYNNSNLLFVEKKLGSANNSVMPTCFVNGKKVISKAVDNFQSLCEEEINKTFAEDKTEE